MVLHVHQWGDASDPPLLCLHGVTAHGERFRRLALELPDVDVQGDTSKPSFSQSMEQSFFVDDLPARDVDQNRS